MVELARPVALQAHGWANRMVTLWKGRIMRRFTGWTLTVR